MPLHTRTHDFELPNSSFCALLISFAGFAAAQTAPSRAASVVDSMPQAKRIEQAAISPDGTHVAYIVDGALNVASAGRNSTHPLRSKASSNSASVSVVGRFEATYIYRRLAGRYSCGATLDCILRRKQLNQACRFERIRRRSDVLSRRIEAGTSLHRRHPAHRRAASAYDSPRRSHRRTRSTNSG